MIVIANALEERQILAPPYRDIRHRLHHRVPLNRVVESDVSESEAIDVLEIA